MRPLKLLEKNKHYARAFANLGNTWILSQENTFRELESFVCLMYGYRNEAEIDTVRYIMLGKIVGQDYSLGTKKKVDFSRLPPCKRSLRQHIIRVNYRVRCFKLANRQQPAVPKPYAPKQGWIKDTNGTVIPKWVDGCAFPQSIMDVLEEESEEIEDDEEVNEEPEDHDELDDIASDFSDSENNDSDDNVSEDSEDSED